MAFVELLFFAYRDFTREADAVLAEYDLGRAHHRVLHFVNRQPGLKVAELLDILKITKQSLARVLKDLVDQGWIAQQAGVADRRQRLLYATPKLKPWPTAWIACRRIAWTRRWLLAAPGNRDAVAQFLFTMTSEEERAKVGALLPAAITPKVDAERD